MSIRILNEEKEALNLKESQEHMEGFGGRKRKGEMIYYNVKNRRHNKKKNQGEIQGQGYLHDAKGSKV